jgi:hypothetical protein
MSYFPTFHAQSTGMAFALSKSIKQIKEVFMVLRVQYHNDKFDYVNDLALDRLIITQGIKKFYRPSEEKWVTIGADPTRGIGGHYTGPDRRQNN